MLLGYSEEQLKEKKGYATASEITQQPRLWYELYNILLEQKNEIVEFLNPILKLKGIKIILTGAGTSAFVGNSSEGFLRRKFRVDVEAIATTDIMATPHNFFFHDRPVLVISHARSGDSPESVATIKIIEKIINNAYFLNIICNRSGKLAIETRDKKNCLNIYLPDDSNDEGFAMTSSFTCMLLTDLMLPYIEHIEDKKGLFEKLSLEAERILKEDYITIREIAEGEYDRLVYLGDGDLNGCAKEAALKSLELTCGKVNTSSNTYLGFRHGPKSVINEKTVVGFFVSQNPYTQKYEFDLIHEIAMEIGGRKLIAFLPNEIRIDGLDYVFYLKGNFNDLDDALLTPLYIIYGQMLGFYKSLFLGITPDNPDPSGRVNRVVRGVRIYEY